MDTIKNHPRPERSEIQNRIAKFYETMCRSNPDWNTAIIVSNINQYYFTGTMQDAILIFKRNGDYNYFVRRSFDRAAEQSLIPINLIKEISGYKDVALTTGNDLKNCYLEEETIPLAMLSRMKKYLTMDKTGAVDPLIKYLRSVKSEYELSCLRESGRLQDKLITDSLPKLLREGMSEAEFMAAAYHEMLKSGHHGVSRFSAFQTEIIGGQFAFGDGTLKSSSFNGPAGMRPFSPAVPAYTSTDRKLKKGDLVFADFAFGIEGYHTDKTQVYIFKGKVSDETREAHLKCMQIQNRIAKLLKPGNIPSKIYAQIIESLPEDFKNNFMGYGKAAVKFLGHGVGLVVDEFPVLAKGFDDPLEENMTLALEPKKALEGIGLVGVEETFVVTAEGAKLLTGGAREIIEVS